MIPATMVTDLKKLKAMCEFINDIISDTGIVAVPGEQGIAWNQVYPGAGQYRVTQKRSFRILVQAGYNPKQLVEFAQGTWRQHERQDT